MPSTNSATTNAAPGSEAATAEGDTAEEEERRLAGAVKDMQLGSRDSAISSRRSSKGVDGENGGEGKGESADVKEGDMVAVRQQMLMLPPEWWEGAQRVAQQGRNSVEVHRCVFRCCVCLHVCVRVAVCLYVCMLRALFMLFALTQPRKRICTHASTHLIGTETRLHRHMLFLCGLPPEPLTAGLWMKQRREVSPYLQRKEVCCRM